MDGADLEGALVDNALDVVDTEVGSEDLSRRIRDGAVVELEILDGLVDLSLFLYSWMANLEDAADDLARFGEREHVQGILDR
eukprot:13209621-Heterocapsa_arctica.AAC.1